MTRETKVGLAVAASFVCLVGGVFATKYLHKPDGTAPVVQTPAPEKLPGAGEEPQQNPPAPPTNPGEPLYKGPESKGVPPIDQPPFEPNTRKPTAPPPDLNDPLGPPSLAPSKPNKPTPPLNSDPNKDDVFDAAPAKPMKPTVRPPVDDVPPLLPVPSGPADKGGPPPIDLPPTKAPQKGLPPDDGLAPPPVGGIKRVANPPPKSDDGLPGLALPGDEKKEAKPGDTLPLPVPGAKNDPPVTLPPPSGGAPNLPPPNIDPKINVPPPNIDPKINVAPPMDKKKPADKNPLDLDIPMTPSKADAPKPPISDVPPPLPKPQPPPAAPAKPVDDGSSMLPKAKPVNPAASLGPKPGPADDKPPVGAPEPRVDSYDEEWYYCKQGDSLESISQKFFFTPKYEQALRQYNLERNDQPVFHQTRPALPVGQTVKVPPARILEMKYMRPTTNPKPDAGAPTTPAAPGAGTEDLGSPREYEVKKEGMTLRDIAKEEFRDERQWTRLVRLNAGWNPNEAIPVGTRIYLPRSQ